MRDEFAELKVEVEELGEDVNDLNQEEDEDKETI